MCEAEATKQYEEWSRRKGLFRDRLIDPCHHNHETELFNDRVCGIAHDINNVLSVILGLAEVLSLKGSVVQGDRDDVDAIIAATLRGSSLVQGLQRFTRNASQPRAVTSLEEIVRNLADVFARLLPDRVELRIHLDESLPTIECNGPQISQMLMNLCMNASEAVGKSGSISIYVRSVLLDATNDLDLPPGRYIAIRIDDDGSGMDARTAREATKPHFTTKSCKEGAGLGLFMADHTARQHGGRLRLCSTPGLGTRVTVWLPSCANGETLELTERAGPEQ